MTDYPEHDKLLKVRAKSQTCGEFLEWLQGKYSLCTFDERRFGGTWWPVTIDIPRLLADYFEIDLDKVDAEKKEMLVKLQKEPQQPTPVEAMQDWFFTFGCGQPHEGYYCVIYGTFGGAREEMFRRHGGKWSMQYRSAEDAGVEEWNLRELK
jgi:hypothetical protein